MITTRPLAHAIRRAFGLNRADLAATAHTRWDIAPAEIMAVPPVIILPGQAERIRQTEFTTLPSLFRSLAGDPAERIRATTAYRLRDVHVVDGVLHAPGVTLHLRQRQRRGLLGRLRDCGKAALYESWVGNRWFGNWLTDDCLTYPLAAACGVPATTMPARSGHVPRYEALLGMAPLRIGDAHFDELILFDDHANNSDRIRRAREMRARLLAAVIPEPPRPVLLLRGRTGDPRILENEADLAEGLHRDYGFRVLQPEEHAVDALIAACANAPIVAGVEGSQLNHGIVAMPSGAALLTIQPPDRATTAMKLLTDRWEQRFAMLIGHGEARSFRVDPGELHRTVELIFRECGK